MKWNSLHKGTEGLSSVWGDRFLCCTGCVCLGQRDDKGLATKWCKWGTFLPVAAQSRWCETSADQPLCLCKWREELCQTAQNMLTTQIFLLKIRFWWFFLFPSQCFPWWGRQQANHTGAPTAFSESFFSRPLQQGSSFSKMTRALSLWPGGKLDFTFQLLSKVYLLYLTLPRGGLEQCWDQVFDVTLQVSRNPWEWEERWKEEIIFLCPRKIFSEKDKNCIWSSLSSLCFLLYPVPSYLGSGFQPPYPNTLPVPPQTLLQWCLLITPWCF